MLAKYAMVMGLEAPAISTGVAFADAESMATYAKDAVAAMQKAGIIGGKPGGVFDPKAGATRSEVSTFAFPYSVCLMGWFTIRAEFDLRSSLKHTG